MTQLSSLANTIFSDKLDSDERQPFIIFDVAQYLGGPSSSETKDGVLSFAIVPLNIFFWVQLLAYLSLGIMLGYFAAVVNYYLIVRRRKTISRLQTHIIGYGFTIPVCIAFPYLVIGWFGIRNFVIKFACATIMPVLTMFKTLEAVFDTHPPCVESSIRQYILYFSSPLEVCYDRETNTPKKAKHIDTLRALWDFVLFLVILGMYQSIFGPYGYEPFETNVRIGSAQYNSLRDFFAPSHLANNLIGALLLQLYLTAFCSGLKLITSIVVGVETKTVMSNALFDSGSPSDFWGRKWNTLIHGVLKRATFKPVVKSGYPRALAAAAAFAASGLFHEWLFSEVFYVHEHDKDENGQCSSCYQPNYGYNLLFFLINAVIMTAEYTIGKHFIFTFIKTNLPRPVVSLLVISTALPCAHFFLHDYIQSDYFVHGSLGFPLFVLQ